MNFMKTLPENAACSAVDLCSSELIKFSRPDTSIMEQSLQKMFDEFIVFISKTDFE